MEPIWTRRLIERADFIAPSAQLPNGLSPPAGAVLCVFVKLFSSLDFNRLRNQFWCSKRSALGLSPNGGCPQNRAGGRAVILAVKIRCEIAKAAAE
jgi:hypothetical protein